MTRIQEDVAQLHCPRCGGLMQKPVGSTLYWHADRNHPRCEITNIVESVLEIPQQPTAPADPPPDPPKPRSRRGNR